MGLLEEEQNMGATVTEPLLPSPKLDTRGTSIGSGGNNINRTLSPPDSFISKI